MKTHLYYFNWQLQLTLYGSILDDLEKMDQEHDIYFLSCNGILKPCWSNRDARDSACKRCKFNQKSGISGIRRKVHNLKIEEFVNPQEIEDIFQNQNFKYDTVEDIKLIRYKGIRIGYGALSSYISWTRNREPIIDDKFKIYFNKLLKNEILLKEAIDRVLEAIKPEVITIFNGRTADVRPVFETALQNGIFLRGVENIMPRLTEFRKVVFENVLPHSIQWHTRRINEH